MRFTSERYRETDFNGRTWLVTKETCTCDCHKPGMAIMHFMACCNGGFTYRRKEVVPLGTKRRRLLDNLNIIVPRNFIEYSRKYPLTPDECFLSVQESQVNKTTPK